MGVPGIAAVTLFDAAPSKAVLYIDFIPLSGTQTRIQASGSLTVSSLVTPGGNVNNTTASGTGANSSRINITDDILRFTYGNPGATITGKRYPISGTNPFPGTGLSQPWAGTTPVNNIPPLIIRTGTPQDIWLPNTFSAGAINGTFDVNSSLTAIFGSSTPAQFVFNSGTEQIIFRINPTLVPGPLPLFGAAAAFGYSRKLRNRIQKSIPARLV